MIGIGIIEAKKLDSSAAADNDANTFIGGVASTITTAAALASILQIAENRIRNFEINGDDISAEILYNYDLNISAFKGNVNITYYYDKGNLVQLINEECFRVCSNLEWVSFNGCLIVASRAFSDCYKLRAVEFNSLEQLIGDYIFYDTIISVLHLPELVSMTNLSIADTSFKENHPKIINIPECIYLGSTTGNDNIFNYFLSRTVLILNPALQTSYSGAEEGDIADARSKGLTIIYREENNHTAPDPITDLEADQVFSQTVSLSFTVPASVNTITYYIVTVDGLLNSFYKASSYNFSAVNLTENKEQEIIVYAVDQYFNISEASNAILITTLESSNSPLPNSGVVNYIPFDTDVAPRIGNTTNYRPLNTGLSLAGRNGGSLFFSGTQNTHQIYHQSSLNADTFFSFSINVKFATVRNSWILAKRSGGTISYQLIYYQGAIRADVAGLTYSKAWIPVAEQWYNLICTINQTTKQVQIYIDNIEIAGANSGTMAAIPIVTTPLELGRFNNFIFHGSMSNLLINNNHIYTPTERAFLSNFGKL